MIEPGIPLNETLRLATLKSLNVLDTPAEERFDRVTRMAKRMFRVPIALVSIVDEDRQWFKSVQGLDACQTPRNVSFCGHAILGDGIFLIRNALQDQRFADNPLVAGAPHIRFYAGCPLRAPDGNKVGTLCIIDTAPRDFDEEDATALRDLAAMVEDELSAFQTSTTDDLTGISNRRGFLQLAQYGLSFCVRNSQPAALAFIDLDRFKPINDQFGHAEGDIALAAFAEVMQASFRATDLFARLGGDEFVVLLTGARKSDAETVLHKFSQLLADYNARAMRGYNLEFSCGVVEFNPAAPQAIDQLLAAGDAQMYALKAAKKQRH
ncbi:MULTISPECIES: sensor domain-containing diguanylate cyclase [unclassified Duganella]|uniref:sensor domain-containing diguanylate cyclase n=1 Tax=unclassified Duganella TaxID=2636909 RepID=UPI00088B6B47|nr:MULTISPECIES: sensor domain-containing diguanylate cyclase [unclassified Duganella]SDG55966.1 diguanylate cyclase (GGDEF) domain-containing protein [Duganella sp. OV458]SDJ78784.1 diguanylate cyclase with GAF sensor [Duganella sp. OV510]